MIIITLIMLIIFFIMILVLVFLSKSPYEQGEDSYIDGLTRNSNPYNGLKHKRKFLDWNNGYNDSKDLNADDKYW